MILVMPVMDGHEWTQRTVRSMEETVSGGRFALVVWDNGSEVPYTREEFEGLPFSYSVCRSVGNAGYYAPLFEGWEDEDELVGLVHNDLFFHELRWNERVERAFAEDDRLGVAGFVGSYEVDEHGGRGAGTMCNFREKDAHGNVIGQPQTAGELIHGLRPSLVLDSLFMLFRASALVDIDSDADDLPLAHFYDKIWPLRLVEANWRVGTLGVEVSHWGGITCVLNQRYVADCKRWCWERGVREVPNDDWQLQMYREAERRLLSEHKTSGGLIPSRINLDWSVRRGDQG